MPLPPSHLDLCSAPVPSSLPLAHCTLTRGTKLWMAAATAKKMEQEALSLTPPACGQSQHSSQVFPLPHSSFWALRLVMMGEAIASIYSSGKASTSIGNLKTKRRKYT